MRPPAAPPSRQALQTLGDASRASCALSDVVLAGAITGVTHAAERRVWSIALRLRVSADVASRAAARDQRTG